MLALIRKVYKRKTTLEKICIILLNFSLLFDIMNISKRICLRVYSKRTRPARVGKRNHQYKNSENTVFVQRKSNEGDFTKNIGLNDGE